MAVFLILSHSFDSMKHAVAMGTKIMRHLLLVRALHTPRTRTRATTHRRDSVAIGAKAVWFQMGDLIDSISDWHGPSMIWSAGKWIYHTGKRLCVVVCSRKEDIELCP